MICFLGHDQSYYVSAFQVVVVAGLKLLPIWPKQYADRASKPFITTRNNIAPGMFSIQHLWVKICLHEE